MNLLEACRPSRWIDFLTIDDNDPQQVIAGQDLFIGLNQHITLTIPNGATINFRDILVIGKLTIQSSDINDTVNKGKIIANDIFAPGDVSSINIHLKCRNYYQPKNRLEFRRELGELIIDWLAYQREITNKIGLKSILI
jgi:hypothetical protein